MINLISFIVIGKNEDKNLRRCFAGIYKFIDVNAISSFEIIYVDSKSSDDTLDIARSFADIKTYQITGQCNAAVGRNVGATVANGKVLYFIDADMEIIPSFHSEVFTSDGSLKYPAVSGLIKDVESGTVTHVRYEKMDLPFFTKETLDGGIFLMKRDVWQRLKGMRTKFRTGEDGDLGLRMAKLNIPFRRIKRPITLHHTVSYHDKTRMWQMVWNKSIFYWRCVLYREHFFNREMYGLLWKNDKSLLFLSMALVFGISVPKYLVPLTIAYLIIVLLRSIRQKRYNQVIEFIAYYIIVDLLNIVFFFTFFPKRISEAFMKVGGSVEAACLVKSSVQ